MESIFLHNKITIIPHSVYMFHYPITLSILALQLPLYLITISQSLFYVFPPHIIICQ
ncbi:Y55_G0025780.mRNA.1.CDS.1 [Saccharomyces cerevisiae]|nr:Y55_G0025780.mRNA.1.CDS.1 [Saccharomyces cerevisiae]